MSRVPSHKSQVISLAAAAALLLISSWASAQDDALAKLQKRVEEVSAKTTDAFVFLGGGSGVLISADGWALSNFHVVVGAGGKAPDKTKVNLADGRPFNAQIVCSDPLGDLSLLKLEPEEGKPFTYLEFGDSDKLECGQYVVAVGNPFNLGSIPAEDKHYYPSVSLGIISALHRYQQQYSDCIQTDAAVNPGNSGGPLVSLDGKLIGINGRIATRHNNRVNSGVGYAIPVNQIANFLPEMKKGGIDKTVYHGQIRGLEFNTDEDGGVVVPKVGAGSRAAKAGFKQGDHILDVNGYPVPSPWRLLGVIGTYPMYSEMLVKVKRGEENLSLKVRLSRGTGLDVLGQQLKSSGAYLGVTIEEREDGDGAEVTLVGDDSPAEQAGLEEGDLIVRIDGEPVDSRDTVIDHVQLRKPGDTIKLVVLRDGKELEFTVTLGARQEQQSGER